MKSVDPALSSSVLKQCCADLYSGGWPRLLLGEAFRPGGLQLTEQAGIQLGLDSEALVLDIASGTGATVRFLAKRFGCRVIGLDYGREAVVTAAQTGAAGAPDRAAFAAGDAEALPFRDGALDAAICECSFCTFPAKETAAQEVARVLRPGGRFALTDVTRDGPLPPELDGVLGWVSCLADARPAAGYAAILEAAGLEVMRVTDHTVALQTLLQQVRGRLLAAEVLCRTGQLELPPIDFSQAHETARAVGRAVNEGSLGYAMLVAVKQPCSAPL